MFFQSVVIEAGTETLAKILRAYGIPTQDFNKVLKEPANADLVALPGGPIHEHTDLRPRIAAQGSNPKVISVRVKIDVKVSHDVKRVYEPKGLRPQGNKPGPTDGKTHGVHGIFWGNQGPSTEIRWLQTATKTYRAGAASQTLNFVDNNPGGWGLPWYNMDKEGLFVSDRLDDTPCDFEATAKNKGMIWVGTTSLAVRSDRSITLIHSFTWGFEIGVGKTIAAITMAPDIHVSNAAEIVKHLDLLRKAENIDKKNTGQRFAYREIPPEGSINPP